MFDPYDEWKVELEIWREFTSLEKSKQGPALVLSLSGNARKAARSVPIADLKKDNGIDLILVELDKYYSRDEGRRQMKAFDEFINFRRSEGMSVRDFLLQFELKHNACKTMKMDIPDNILAHSMLACANLPPEKKDIVSSCLTTFTSANVREQIIKIFPNMEHSLEHQASSSTEASGYNKMSELMAIKTEDVNHTESHDVYYANNNNSQNGNSSNHRFKSHGRGNVSVKSQSWSRTSYNDMEKLNPLDDNGEPTKCNYCYSICHWRNKCPDAPRKSYNRYNGRKKSDL